MVLTCSHPLKDFSIRWKSIGGKCKDGSSNCFQSTAVTVPILAAESCLPPPAVLLPHQRWMAGLRLIYSPTSINPTSGRICRSFPALLRARAPDSHRALCTGLAPNVMPLNQKTPLRCPPVRTHLLVDALAHVTLPLLEGLSLAPLFNSTFLPNLPALPSDEIMTNAYRALKR